MQGHLEDEKTSWLAFFTCFFVYVFVCMTKNTYASAMSAIVDEGLFNKADVGVINASFYLIYGCTQMFGGGLVDKFSPFKILMFGVILSGMCNIVMAVSTSFVVMLVAWSINGLAQFGIWPAILKLVATLVMPEHRQKSMTYLAFAYPAGTIISYLTAAGVLKVSKWSGLFWVSSAVLVITVVFLHISAQHIQAKLVYDKEETVERKNKENLSQEKQVSLGRLLLVSGLIFMTIPALIRCMLDIGLKNWVPTMIMESYNITPSFANFITTFLLIVNLFGVFLVNWLYPRYCKNAVTAIFIFFVVSIPLLILILLTGKINLVFIILSLALVTTFMIACSQLMNVIIPAMFEKQGRTGVIAGFLNSFGAFGCMAANYAYGYLAENFGWTVTSVVWLVLCVISVVFCLVNAPIWKKFTKEGN